MIVPLLTLVTHRARATMPLPELAREAVSGGVDVIQIREPDLDEANVELLVVEIVKAVGKDRVAVNNAPLLAAKHGVHLHLPERSLGGSSNLVGVVSVSCSVHGPDSLGQLPDWIDYVVAGHVFPTSSHPGHPPLGVDGLGAMVDRSRLPVIAIGGVTPENADAALATGVSGVAVMSYVNSSKEPRLAARRLRNALERTMLAQANVVTLQVNGKSMSVEPGTTLTTFLEGRNLHPRLVVVERNREIVAKSAYDSTVLEKGDLLEVAHFVGGG